MCPSRIFRADETLALSLLAPPDMSARRRTRPPPPSHVARPIRSRHVITAACPTNLEPTPHLPRAHFAAGPREAQIGPAPGRAGPEGTRNLAARTRLAQSAPPPSRRRRRPTPATGARRRPSSASPSAACTRSPASAPVSSFLLWPDLSLTSLSLFSPQDLPPPPREAPLDVGGPHRCRERRPRPVLHRIRPVLAVPAAVLLPSRLAGASRCAAAAVPRSRSDREEDNAPVGPASWAQPRSPKPACLLLSATGPGPG